LVQALLLNQVLVASPLYDFSLLYDQNFIGMLDSAQSMRNDQGSPVFH
jgi:hypothetical protein